MANLRNHPGMWLREDAEASLARFEADHGKQQINSAGRTVADQNGLIARWNRGGAANRPPNLYQPAPSSGPNASRHVTNGGTAIDVGNPAIFHKYGAEYGWLFLFEYDKVHFEYNPAYDKHRPANSAGPSLPGFNQVVKNEQAWLNQSRGEKLDLDGRAGPKFKAAVERYQTFLKKYGYTGRIDGVWGNGTQTSHQKYYNDYHKPKPAPASAKPLLKRGSKGADVVALQKALNAKYPSYSKLRVDGDFGKATEDVVKELQRRAKLTVDGKVGTNTWKWL